MQRKNWLQAFGLGGALGGLVPSGKVPCQAHFPKTGEYGFIACIELERRQHAAVWVIDMGVCTGLVEHQVGFGAVIDGGVQPGFVRAIQYCGTIVKEVPLGTMDNPIDTKGLDDFVRAVAVVGIAVQDGHTIHHARLFEHHGRDHQTVECAKSQRGIGPRVMESGCWRARRGVVDHRVLGGREHGAGRVGQRARNRHVGVAESILDRAVQHTIHKSSSVSELEVVGSNGLKRLNLDVQTLVQPVFYDQLGFQRGPGNRVGGSNLFWTVKNMHGE